MARMIGSDGPLGPGFVTVLLEKSLQAQILIPLASSLAFGLIAATVIALFLVPSIYCILDDFGVLGELQQEPEMKSDIVIEQKS